MKVKLRKIGNSIGVLLPRESIVGYNIGDEIELEVITKNEKINNLKRLIDVAPNEEVVSNNDWS